MSVDVTTAKKVPAFAKLLRNTCAENFLDIRCKHGANITLGEDVHSQVMLFELDFCYEMPNEKNIDEPKEPRRYRPNIVSSHPELEYNTIAIEHQLEEIGKAGKDIVADCWKRELIPRVLRKIAPFAERYDMVPIINANVIRGPRGYKPTDPTIEPERFIFYIRNFKERHHNIDLIVSFGLADGYDEGGHYTTDMFEQLVEITKDFGSDEAIAFAFNEYYLLGNEESENGVVMLLKERPNSVIRLYNWRYGLSKYSKMLKRIKGVIDPHSYRYNEDIRDNLYGRAIFDIMRADNKPANIQNFLYWNRSLVLARV